MALEDLSLLSRRERIRLAVLLAALIAVIVWASVQFLNPGPSRRVVLASGAEFGLYHQYAKRYKELLAREGVTVEERMTSGAAENLQLLLDPKSGVDVAFMQGGVVPAGAAEHLDMLASLYYEPLWIFYRGKDNLQQFSQLFDKRIAVGAPGSGTRALAEPLAKANGLLRGNTELVALGGGDALRALQAGEVDAAVYIGGAQTSLIQQPLRDPGLNLMNFARAESYARQYPFISRLTLPAGTIDMAFNIPDRDITLIGTKSMLVARDDLHPAIINLLLDAAREIHGTQGIFEAAGEFPGTAPVDLPVSPYADQHKRFGPSVLYRYLPFWLAALAERTIIIVVPLLVILIPAFNFLPQFLRWRVRSRIFRWYGELALLERDVATHKGALPLEQWLSDLDRIEHAVRGIRTPAQFASEAYTLREHIGLVRRAAAARASAEASAPVASAPGS
jgi:TRAP transporter TAXI family solute receptor